MGEQNDGDQNIRYYLDLEEQRLKKRNLSMKLEFKAYNQVSSTNKVVKTVPRLNVLEFTRYITA